jgi:hypothetical protein
MPVCLPRMCRLQTNDTSVRSHGLNIWTGSVLLAVWLAVLIVTVVLGTSLTSPPPPLQWWQVFYRTGSIIYGGGQVVLPMLYNDVVQQTCDPGTGLCVDKPDTWVTSKQFYAGEWGGCLVCCGFECLGEAAARAHRAGCSAQDRMNKQAVLTQMIQCHTVLIGRVCVSCGGLSALFLCRPGCRSGAAWSPVQLQCLPGCHQSHECRLQLHGGSSAGVVWPGCAWRDDHIW